MQKLLIELENTPRNIPQVSCSVNSQLNKEETLSVENKVLVNNNLEVDLSQHTGKLKVNVYVISKQGFPLMPCSCAKAKHLLREEKAKVIKRSPFTIQLNFECENIIQDIVLGIDTGYGFIGFSATSEKFELISGTLKLDDKTKERLYNKKMYRKKRRSKLWYRKSRWKNRVSTKKKGWLPPSTERRYKTHLNLIERIKKLLPISKIIVEIAKFDIQKLENPNIKGKDYQQGEMYGYQNVKSYLMSREKGLCEHCKKDFKNNSSHIHHRKLKSKGGTNKPNNLMLVHKKCHEYIHTNPALIKKYEKISGKEYKHSTFMSTINKKFYEDIENLEITYGNITFVDRNNLGLEKTHYNDAFIITKGNTQKRSRPFNIIQKHRNNRILQKNVRGRKKAIRKIRYKIQPLDLIWIGKNKYYCKGIQGKGRQVLIKKGYIVHIDKVDKYFNHGGLIWKY